ncbi:cell cycle checkpoint control protein rad9a [Phlyctochytrium bullatum]|nr:cell cycle checkpoint control protein rad9a [Phlyctochytrium bullatum]
MQAVYSKTGQLSKLVVTPKSVQEWIACFSPKLEEISAVFTENAMKFTTAGPPQFAGETERQLETEISVDKDEFEVYSILNPCTLTFNFRDFKSAAAFAEISGLNLTILFLAPGRRPVILTVEYEDLIIADFVLATLADGTSEAPLPQEPIALSAASSQEQIPVEDTIGNPETHQASAVSDDDEGEKVPTNHDILRRGEH